MDLNVILLVCTILACTFSVLSLLLGVTALLKVMSMEKSTHTMQWMPAEQTWADTDAEIEEINKEFKEDNEDIVGL